MVSEVIVWMSVNKCIAYDKELIQIIFIQKFPLQDLAERKGRSKSIYFAIINTRYPT